MAKGFCFDKDDWEHWNTTKKLLSVAQDTLNDYTVKSFFKSIPMMLEDEDYCKTVIDYFNNICACEEKIFKDYPIKDYGINLKQMPLLIKYLLNISQLVDVEILGKTTEHASIGTILQNLNTIDEDMGTLRIPTMSVDLYDGAWNKLETNQKIEYLSPKIFNKEFVENLRGFWEHLPEDDKNKSEELIKVIGEATDKIYGGESSVINESKMFALVYHLMLPYMIEMEDRLGK